MDINLMFRFLGKFFYFSLALFLCLFFVSLPTSAQTQSSDAIAIRVLPNPEHYSAATWYKLQGFSGSPQSIIVDGYEAVRDGRSVYVEAANVQGGNLYTNIYLISFNQEAENATMDIFGQILSRWKFNTNYIITNVCDTSSTISCLHSDDCPIGEYCLSAKAKMIRDTKRLADLADIKILIENYQAERGYYPILKSGSYISHVTTSVWPSWQKILAQHLGQELSVDPINKMGDCGDPRFDKETCWDILAQEFADGDTSNDEFDLPADSYVYVYTTNADGSSYDLYANLEEGYGASISGGMSGGATGSTVANSAPSFVGKVLSGKSGEEFNGFISVEDDSLLENLTVTIDTSSSVWTAWSAPPEVELVPSVPSQRKIHASSAGYPGNYFFDATVDDGRGLSTTQTFMIVIVNDPPQINVFDVSYTASTTKPLDVYFQIRDAVSNYPLTYTITPNGAYGLNPATFTLNGAGTVYNLNINGFLNRLTQSPIDPSRVYSYLISVTDSFGASSNDNFTITALNNKPNINIPLTCDTHIRVGNTYNSCTISANDIDGHAISYYSFGSLPSGMLSSPAGTISGTPVFSEYGVHNVTVQATDEFGAISPVANYALNVDTYCGDGVKQGPGEVPSQNMEMRGGPTNDGREACDGVDGIATAPSLSSIDRMYACTTPSITTCPLTGSCMGACSFVTGPSGGYCGDTITQDGNSGSTDFGEECDDGMAAGPASGEDRCDTRNVNGYGYCALTYCGDGVVQYPNGRGTYGVGGTGNEECDDYRNGSSADPCYDNCTLTYCGDNIVQNQPSNGYRLTEECDNGAANALTGECDTDCTLTYCGDGVIQAQNGVYSGGVGGTGNEGCEVDSDCAQGFDCNNCSCGCIPCAFDEEDFDYCCFP